MRSSRRLDSSPTCTTPRGGTDVFLADTNALYHNPDLDAWRFPEHASFCAPPTVDRLKELDEAKVNYRTDVQKKAEGLIDA